MSIRKVSFVFGEYYHVYNRGNDKKIIFHDDNDYKRFINLLHISNSKDSFLSRDFKEEIFSREIKEKLVSIGAYCLMPNHFHLILTQTEDGSISKFMHKLTTAYSMYYNKKYERSGVLFEAKFKSKYIDNEIYFKYLFSYVHLNPVKLIQKDWKEVGIRSMLDAENFLKVYMFSSYLDYMGIDREQSVILNRNAFPDFFPSKENFKKEIFEWLSFDPDETVEALPMQVR